MKGVMAMASPRDGVKVVAHNKKAYHDYFVLEKYEAGIELAGTEVKSVRHGAVNLKDSYCTVKNGELFVQNLHISPYEKGNIFNKDPQRPKRLLMHKREIMKLYGQLKQEGLALVPLSVYFKGPLVKVELGLCKGKKLYDKRESIARKEVEREMDRRVKAKNI
jgi:SsrA-binding protein